MKPTGIAPEIHLVGLTKLRAPTLRVLHTGTPFLSSRWGWSVSIAGDLPRWLSALLGSYYSFLVWPGCFFLDCRK